MAIDQLLRGVRSLVLSSALAYSACGGDGNGCENDYDCARDEVCNYRNGRCEPASEGEAEAEAEGERIPWYEGMCEDYRNFLTGHFEGEIVNINAGNCEESCLSRPANNPRGDDLDCGESYRVCVNIYCNIQSDCVTGCTLRDSLRDDDIDFDCSRRSGNEFQSCAQNFCEDYYKQYSYPECGGFGL